MSIKISTAYFASFNMPGICANCGSEQVVDTIKVGHGQSDWSGKHTTSLSLDFPMCQKCYDLSIKKKKVLSIIIMIFGFLLAISVCFMIGVIGNSSDTTSGIIILLGFAVGIGILLLARRVSDQIFLKDLTPEDRIEYKNIQNCVKILKFKPPSLFAKQGSITFEFRNNAFGNEFSQRNLGKIV